MAWRFCRTIEKGVASNNPNAGFEPDALWYKDAIIYEVHVRAFYGQ